MKNINIAKNINIIESLKSRTLYKIADIYQNDAGGFNDKSDSIADLIILLYLLSEKMGFSHEKIDEKIISRLKSGIKSEDGEWRPELQLLLRHFED